MITLSPQPALHGTPTALIRALTPDELRRRHTQLSLQYPSQYRGADDLSRRFHRVAVSEMRRIQKELRQRGERLCQAEGEPKQREDWGYFEIGDAVITKVWGEAVVERVSRDEKYGDWLNVRVRSDGTIRAVHQVELTHAPENLA